MHDCLAGGVVDPGETPEQTATRELREELGIIGVQLVAVTSAAWEGDSAEPSAESWSARRRQCPEEAIPAAIPSSNCRSPEPNSSRMLSPEGSNAPSSTAAVSAGNRLGSTSRRNRSA